MVFCFALLITLSSSVFSQTNSVVPDVLVVVAAPAPFVKQVSVNYLNVVEKETVNNDLKSITKLTGWVAEGVEIDVGEVNNKKSTSVSFGVKDIANAQYLPLEAIITSLKRFSLIEVLYIGSDVNKFSGLKDFDNDSINIKFEQMNDSYRYKVRIKNANFDQLNLPTTQQEAQNAKKQPNNFIRFAIIIGFAFIGALLVYWLLGYLAKKGK